MTHRPYDPPAWARNPHVNTIVASFARRGQNLKTWPERLELPDGDFVDLAWTCPASKRGDRPIVVVFHGLEGNLESGYVRDMLGAIHNAGWTGVLMHFRGCSGVLNRKLRLYHSGETEDPRFLVKTLAQRHPNVPLAAIGYSLGGNMLSKLMGEEGEDALLCAAVVVSAPLRLQVCAEFMREGFAKLYQWYLLQPLKARYKAWIKDGRMSGWPQALTKGQLNAIESIFEFDERVTAPLHGFDGAVDYYTRSSGCQYLHKIARPTLIIHAKDDPFMTPEILPTPAEMSKHVELEASEHGGHVGFLQGSPLKCSFWLAERVPTWLRPHIEAQGASTPSN